jgi:hypothetical protein
MRTDRPVLGPVHRACPAIFHRACRSPTDFPWPSSIEQITILGGTRLRDSEESGGSPCGHCDRRRGTGWFKSSRPDQRTVMSRRPFAGFRYLRLEPTPSSLDSGFRTPLQRAGDRRIARIGDTQRQRVRPGGDVLSTLKAGPGDNGDMPACFGNSNEHRTAPRSTPPHHRIRLRRQGPRLTPRRSGQHSIPVAPLTCGPPTGRRLVALLPNMTSQMGTPAPGLTSAPTSRPTSRDRRTFVQR